MCEENKKSWDESQISAIKAWHDSRKSFSQINEEYNFAAGTLFSIVNAIPDYRGTRSSISKWLRRMTGAFIPGSGCRAITAVASSATPAQTTKKKRMTKKTSPSTNLTDTEQTILDLTRKLNAANRKIEKLEADRKKAELREEFQNGVIAEYKKLVKPAQPEKVDAERRAKEAPEAERKALAKKEATREKAHLKTEEKKRLADEKNRLIWPFLIQFVDDIKSGARKIGSDDYAPGSCKAWKSYIGVYEGFDPLHRFGWADIDRAFVSRYINYLQKHGYMPKVVNKHLTNLKALINAAFIDGIHDNQRAASLIVKKKIEDRDKAVEIYLTEDELQALYEMPLTGKNDHIRDVFLIGCYTCQRVSDYNNLNADNFETTRKGTRIIRLVQQKTKTEVTIPILNENLIAICEKYGYNIPKANEQVLNRYIKNILKELSDKVPSLKEKVPTKLTMKQKEALRKEKKEPETDLNGNVIVPRYECVTSHTARRTGITNMYLSHKYTILQMMHVSGHKTQKSFMDYIKLSSEEIADEIAAMSKKEKESDLW